MEGYMGYFADCYVLSNKRTEDSIKRFLDRFVPERKESVNEYEFPQYADHPLTIFKTTNEALRYLVQNSKVSYSIYWENLISSDLRGAELFFTDDSHVIMGIYCETNYENTEIEDRIFQEMKEFCGTEEGYITYETIPPLNSRAFLKVVKKGNSQ